MFSGGADKVAKCFELSTRVATQVAAHAEPVSAVRWIDTPTGGYLATASYDATLKVSWSIIQTLIDTNTLRKRSIGIWGILIR